MILVTGANGFIGSAIVWELNQQNRTNIVCIDSVGLETRNLLKGLHYDKFLLKDEIWSYLEESLHKKAQPNSEPNSTIQAIIHMGACSSTTEMDTDFLEENNTQYTNRLFSWCADQSIPYIYASSAATYGDGNLGFDDTLDSEKLQPLNPYGESKVKSDRWASKQTHTPPNWYGLRFFNVFGPNEYHKDDMASVVFKAFHQIKDRQSLQLFKSHRDNYADGEQMRDFVYVKDISRWVVELLDGQAQSGIYNLGFGQARTWLDLATCIFDSLLKQDINIDWIDIPTDIRERYQYYTKANINKLKNQGISAPQWPLEKSIEDYIKNHLNKNQALLSKEITQR